jgi:hypothetical protein
MRRYVRSLAEAGVTAQKGISVFDPQQKSMAIQGGCRRSDRMTKLSGNPTSGACPSPLRQSRASTVVSLSLLRFGVGLSHLSRKPSSNSLEQR